MSTNQWIRQIHRWLSIAFTVGVLINFASFAMEEPPVWLGVFAAGPLVVLLLTGLYLFALPYVARWRGGRRTSG